MFVDLILFAAFGLLGAWLQRRPSGERVRAVVWNVNYVVGIPIVAIFAFLSIDLDRDLLAIASCAVVAWWLTIGVAWVWARWITTDRRTVGALVLAAGFPNTGFVGFPLAHLAFGNDGLRLAVVYDQVSLLVPAIVVATVLARHFAGDADGDDATRRAERRALVRTVVLSPPLWTVFALLVYRIAIHPEPIALEGFGNAVGHVYGPVGFLLLGLSVPLHGFAHGRRDLVETGGAVVIRLAVAPALVGVVALATQVDIPPATYLAAAMPTAFHALVISRLHDLDAATVRLGLVVSTSIAIVGTILLTALST